MWKIFFNSPRNCKETLTNEIVALKSYLKQDTHNAAASRFSLY